MAKEDAIDFLEWQLHSDNGEYASFSARFRAENPDKKVQGIQEPSFTGELTLSGQTGQSFILCARELSSEGFALDVTSTNEEATSAFILSLTEATGRLTISHSEPCPEYYEHQYPFVSEQHIRSEKPFLVLRKRENRDQDRPGTGFIPAGNPAIKPQTLLSASGVSFDTDDHNDFKYPPFMPMPDKAMANLILLPTLSLPANWRDHLPFVGLYHWLTESEHEGITILIRFDHLPPLTVRVSQAEARELGEHLLNVRQLLHWLAPKLNGREAFIQQLLELSADSSEQPASLSEETLESIRHQLAIVLEQPDTEFSLDFEYSELMRTLLRQMPTTGVSKKALKKKQPPGNHRLGGNTSKAAPPAISSQNSEQATAFSKAQGREDSSQQESKSHLYPSLKKQDSDWEEITLTDQKLYYTIKVHQTEYRISRERVLRHLFTPVGEAHLQPECQDCQQEVIFISDLPPHAEAHRLNCALCQQFRPGQGTIEARRRMLQAHIDSQCQQYCDHGDSLQSPFPAVALNVLRFIFRFGTEDTLLDLLQESDLPITVEHLQQADQYRRTMLHDLCQYASSTVLQAFMQRFQVIINPGHLLMPDSNHWTPLHYFFQVQSENSVLGIIRNRADLISPQVLALQTHWGSTLFHILHHRKFMQALELLFRQTLGQLPSNLLVLEDFAGLNILHILFALGENRLVYDFIDSQYPQVSARALEAAAPDGETPLHTLCARGSLSAIARLIESCAAHINTELLEEKRPSDGSTPLHLLFSRNHSKLTKLFLDYRYHYLDQRVMSITNNAGLSVLQTMLQNSRPYSAMAWIHKGNLETKQPLKAILERNPAMEWPELLSHMNSIEQLNRNTQLQMVRRTLENNRLEEQSLTPSAPPLPSLEPAPYTSTPPAQSTPPPARAKTKYVAECSICLDDMQDVCAATPCCGIQYHRACIARSLEGQNTCPNCRKKISVQQFITTRMPNIVTQEEEPVPSAIREDINAVGKDGLTRLHHAAIDGETHLIETLVRQGANLEARDSYGGNTPLHLAAEHGHTSTVVALIKARANLEAQDEYCGYTPLHWAVVTNQIETVMELTKQGAKIEAQDQRGKTALLLAAYSGNMDIALMLIKGGANREAQDRNGWTLLHQAIVTNKTEVALTLIKEVGNLEVTDKVRMTPLHMAASHFNKEVSIALIKEGANIQRLPSEEASRVREWLNDAGVTLPNIVNPQAQMTTRRPNTKPVVEIRSVEERDKHGRTRLHYAARNGNIDDLLILMEQGADVEARDNDGRTPLHWAAIMCQVDVIALLVSVFKADLEAVDKENSSPLFYAIIDSGDEKTIGLLIQLGANPNAKAADGVTLLHWAAAKNRKKIITQLILGNANPEAREADGPTALHIAAGLGHVEATLALIEHGANKEAICDGETPLSVAIKADKAETALALAKGGASIANLNHACSAILRRWLREAGTVLPSFPAIREPLATVKKEGGAEPGFNIPHDVNFLHTVAAAGQTQLAETLVEQNFDLKKRDKDGYTPLHIAATNNRKETLLKLIQLGADINAADNNNSTPLHLAVIKGHLETVIALIQENADLELKNSFGTPLKLAIFFKRSDIAEALIQNGANIEAQDENGMRPLHLIAIFEGPASLISLLKNKGVRLEAKDKKGSTPLYLAVMKGNSETATELVKAGAKTESLDLLSGILDQWLADAGITPAATKPTVACTTAPCAMFPAKTLAAQFTVTLPTGGDERDEKGRTKLHRAVIDNDLSATSELIKQGADLEAKDDKGKTPLHYVKCADIAMKLIKHRADVGAKDMNVDTPLHRIACSDIDLGRSEAVQVLIQQGASVNAQSNIMRTPLHWAAFFGNTKIAETLIKHYAHLDAQDNSGKTPLYLAAEIGRTEVAKLLIRNGAKLELKAGYFKLTPLAVAAENNHKETAITLVKGRASVEALNFELAARVKQWCREAGITPPSITKSKMASTATDSSTALPSTLAVQATLSKGQLKHSNPDTPNSRGETPLYLAVKEGDIEAVRALIQDRANPVLVSADGWLPLHLAAFKGQLDSVKLMVEVLGNDWMQYRDNDGWSALHFAAGSGSLPVVRDLLNADNLESTTSEGRTALHLAALAGHFSTVAFLLQEGASLQTLDNEGKTPLHVIAEKFTDEQLEEFWEQCIAYLKPEFLNSKVSGESVRSPAGALKSPVLILSERSDLSDATREPFLYWAQMKLPDDINALIDDYTGTTLHCYVRLLGYTPVALALIKAGAKLEMQNRRGETALHTSASFGNTETALALIKQGAQLEVQDKFGNTVLDHAATSCNTDTVLALIKEGANLKARNKSGNTPLHSAALCGRTQTVLELIKQGISPLEQTRYGTTPLHEAAEGGHSETVLALIEEGAELEAQNSNGKTPLYIAVSKGNSKASVELFRKGANSRFLDYDLTVRLNQWLREAGLLQLPAPKPKATITLADSSTPPSRRRAAEFTIRLDKHNTQNVAAEPSATLLVEPRVKAERKAAPPEKIKETKLTQQKSKLTDYMLKQAVSNGDIATVQACIAAGLQLDKYYEAGETLLVTAAKKGHAAIVKLLLEKGANVDQRDQQYGSTALMFAAENGHSETCKVLLNRGADVNQGKTDDGFTTALMFAAHGGHSETCQVLLEGGADVNQGKTNDGCTALMAATTNDNSETCQVLLNGGADVNQGMTNGGCTALMAAAANGNRETCQVLLNGGADVNQGMTNDGCTALMAAAANGNRETCQVLLNGGAYVNQGRTNDGSTALIFAAQNAHGETCQVLLNGGAYVNQGKTDSSYTALMAAAANGNRETCQVLLNGGVDVNQARTSDGLTALMDAASCGNSEACQVLLNGGADVNQGGTYNGFTALIAAAQVGNSEACQVLLNGGADVNQARTDTLGTALMAAARSGLSETCQVLLNGGADVNQGKTSDGLTALMDAAHGGNSEACQVLLTGGADVNKGKTNDGATALMGAAQYGKGETCQALLSGGADVNQGKTDDGFTALMVAARHGNSEACQTLLNGGADINQGRTDNRDTALMYMLENFSNAQLQKLYKHHRDKLTSKGLNQKNSHKQSAIDNLTQRKDISPEVLEMFLNIACSPVEVKQTASVPKSLDGECHICFERVKDTVFGCGHRTCQNCAYQLDNCPDCRKPITQRIKMY